MSVMTSSFNLSQSVCTIKISFNNENLLLDQNFINNFFFIKSYIDKEMVNYILVDNGSTIIILPLNIIKELEIHIYVYI